MSVSDTATHFIGDVPAIYDAHLGPVIFEDYALDIARRAVAEPAAQCLELAAGTGIVSRVLRDVLPLEAGLTVTDLNAPMLEIARRKFMDGETVAFEAADAMALPYEDGAFDLVVSQFGVMFFPDKPAAFAETRRVLSPGGRFVFNVWRPHAFNAFARIADNLVAEIFADSPPGFYKVPFSYGDAEQIEADMKTAGFDHVGHTAVRFQKRVDDWAHFAHGLVFGNPLAEEVEALGGVSPGEVEVRLAAALEAELGAAPTTMPLEAFVVEARR